MHATLRVLFASASGYDAERVARLRRVLFELPTWQCAIMATSTHAPMAPIGRSTS